MKPGKIITVGVPLVVTGCFLVLSSFAWGRVVTVWAPEFGYTERESKQVAALLTSTKPVGIWKRVDGEPVDADHVIYDSKKRAELLGLVFNTTPVSSGASKGRRL